MKETNDNEVHIQAGMVSLRSMGLDIDWQGPLCTEFVCVCVSVFVSVSVSVKSSSTLFLQTGRVGRSSVRRAVAHR